MNRIDILKPVNVFRRSVRLAVMCAIVVISPHLASAKTANVPPLPSQMANKLVLPKTDKEAFDTPYFDQTKAPLTLNGLKGRGTVVNFWATWCVPCVKEMPSLDRLAKALKGTGVDVITISEDRKPLRDVPPFLKKRGIENLPLYYDVKSKLSRKLGIYGLPSTILIQADGQIAGMVIGTLEWDAPEIKDFLIKILAAKAPATN